QTRLVESLPQDRARLVCLDRDFEAIAAQSEENPAGEVGTRNLAYVIYTSGSTGRPKGVAIEHRALVNLLWSMLEQPGLSDSDVLLAVTSLSFDIAGLEIYLPLIMGAKLVLADRETSYDGGRLLELLNTCGATVMQATPATWQMLVDAGWKQSRLKALC